MSGAFGRGASFETQASPAPQDEVRLPVQDPHGEERGAAARLTADEGRFAIVTNVWWDAVDATRAHDERA